MERRIVCAAMRHTCGAVICSPRHWDDVARGQVELAGGYEHWRKAEEGFVDNKGAFLDRREAWRVADSALQVLRRVGGDDTAGGTLYSENLY